MSDRTQPSGLEQAFLDSRERLLRFFAARGAGDAAEDLLQELWLKVSAGGSGPIAAPLPYLFRAANSLMIDRYRSQVQAARRDHDWSEANTGAVPGMTDSPSAERVVAARQFARLVDETLATLEPRAATAFRRHRVDGIGQRQVAQELGVSLSTVESDLRIAYRALAELKERMDEA
ncbi:RNA polymerase sigma factor [Pelagerythrobacter sp.]|uniref:RNA polymerase sigma factor n=1 Tax=Pelagerythrobacter sp. TaxID=2800702 RepID=UPI0035AE8B8D